MIERGFGSGIAASVVLATLALTCSHDGLAQSGPRLVKLGEEQVAFQDGDPALDPRIDLPFFDAEHRLRWNDTAVYTQATGNCETEALSPARLKASYPPRQPRMLDPRVDERRCPGRDARQGMERTLVGFDASGRVAWQRALVFESGKHRFDLHVIGATEDGIVLNTLEVWSPRNGATLVPARTRPTDGEGRVVPVYQFAYSGFYDPRRQEFYVFSADVTLTKREGGLWRVLPASGTQELILPVRTTSLLGSHDRVIGMALAPGGHHLLMAQEESARGPNSISLAVLDLRSRKVAFEERFCTKRDAVCRDPRVLVAGNGDIGIAYTDLNSRRHVLVRYRMAP